MSSQVVELSQPTREGDSRAHVHSGRRTPGAQGSQTVLLLVVESRRVRIYKVRLSEGVPQQVIPYDPYGHRRGPNRVWDYPAGRPESITEGCRGSVAKTLYAGEPVLVFANGVGAVAVMDAFIEYFKDRHPDVARRLIGSMTFNESELADDRLLRGVREFCDLVCPSGQMI